MRALSEASSVPCRFATHKQLQAPTRTHATETPHAGSSTHHRPPEETAALRSAVLQAPPLRATQAGWDPSPARLSRCEFMHVVRCKRVGGCPVAVTAAALELPSGTIGHVSMWYAHTLKGWRRSWRMVTPWRAASQAGSSKDKMHQQNLGTQNRRSS